MLVGTVGMVLLTPVYYKVIQGIAEKFGGPPEALLEKMKRDQEEQPEDD